MTTARIRPPPEETPARAGRPSTVPLAAYDFLTSRFPEYRHKHVWSDGNRHHFRINRYAERPPSAGGTLWDVCIADSKLVMIRVLEDRVEFEDKTLN